MTKFIEQHVEGLEKEVAELKLMVQELCDRSSPLPEPSTTNIMGDVIEFKGNQYQKVNRKALNGDVVVFRENTSICVANNKPYLVEKVSGGNAYFYNGKELVVYYKEFNRTPETVDVYELIREKPLTPNQQRAEIIEKARKFVEENSISKADVKTTKYVSFGSRKTYIEFVVNPEKHTIVALAKGLATHHVVTHGIAKCASTDVFNEHIGKAIALGRALNLDVSEFKQAVQPTEYTVGQVISYNSSYYGFKIGEIKLIVDNRLWYGNRYVIPNRDQLYGGDKPKIINDTNAKYGGVE